MAAVTNCMQILPVKYFIFIQLIVFLPLALIRNLAKLSTTALIANVFIIAGLIYIFGSEARIMTRRGPSEVKLFNPNDWTLMIGTAIFSFEGIGLVRYYPSFPRDKEIYPLWLGYSRYRRNAGTAQVPEGVDRSHDLTHV